MNTSKSKQKTESNSCDVIVIGSGMGGVSAGCMLAKEGLKTIILEGAHLPGGCSSSYKRKGYVFETGATTLIGFDENQPLKKLEVELGITLTKTEIDPPMTVHLDGEAIIRHKDRDKWLKEAARVFGNPDGQKSFWEEAWNISDTVWRISGKNPYFPPRNFTEWMQMMMGNSMKDAPALRYSKVSVRAMMKRHGVDTPAFKRFLDEQLMITAQAGTEHTPFLFGAAGLTYTNYANYYVDGGLLNMIRELESRLNDFGGEIRCRKMVTKIIKDEETGIFTVITEKGEQYRAPLVISNLPIWNQEKLIEDEASEWFREKSERYDQAWGAFTMGIATGDAYPDDMTLHHQLHLPENESMPMTGAKSVFVSMSRRGDTDRAPVGERALNISCHSTTTNWFNMDGQYQDNKAEIASYITAFLKKNLPGFEASGIKQSFAATPVTWKKWVYREEGRVGGIPQSMDRSIFDWTPAVTPWKDFYLCGDTVYPGQGIPGVTLSGINVYYRIKKLLNQRPKQSS